VHTVGVTPQGILYLDIQKFGESRSEEASTYYVRASDVLTIRRLSSEGQAQPADQPGSGETIRRELSHRRIRARMASMGAIPTVRRYDEGARLNAEDHIPQEVLI